jgi:hypothetical protein
MTSRLPGEVLGGNASDHVLVTVFTSSIGCLDGHELNPCGISNVFSLSAYEPITAELVAERFWPHQFKELELWSVIALLRLALGRFVGIHQDRISYILEEPVSAAEMPEPRPLLEIEEAADTDVIRMRVEQA